MGRGGEGGRAAAQMVILLHEKRSMVMQRLTRRRVAIQKLKTNTPSFGSHRMSVPGAREMTHYEQIFGRYMSQGHHDNTAPAFAVVQTMEILAAYDRFLASCYRSRSP
jgi:hypothetical protein